MSERTYTQEELDNLLEMQKEELKEKAKDWVNEKANEVAEEKAIKLAESYKDLSVEQKLFEQDKNQLAFYVEQGALPTDMTLGKMMMCRQLGRELGLSLIQTINGIAFVNGKPSLYGETYLSLITKNGYKINVISESEEKVEIELEGPNGKQKGSFTKEEAKNAGLWKNVYLKYPIRMLRYKAIRNAQNVLCPHIMGGAYLVDEAEEIKDNENNVENDDFVKEKESKLKNKYTNLTTNQKQDENI